MRIVNLRPAPTIQQGSASKKEINKQVSKEIKMDFGSGFRSGLANSETGRESERAFTIILGPVLHRDGMLTELSGLVLHVKGDTVGCCVDSGFLVSCSDTFGCSSLLLQRFHVNCPQREPGGR